MNPKTSHYLFSFERSERQVEKPTLDKLQKKVKELDWEISQVNKLSISEPIKLCAIMELEEKKKEVVKEMHKCIDEMYS